jgi:dTDP-4-amino-4,6-dideoxygalactose transaminase
MTTGTYRPDTAVRRELATGAIPDLVPFTDLAAMTREVRAEIRTGWNDLLDASQFIGGPAVEQFEASWAEYCGTAYGIGVANGTDALHLVLRALGIGPGDEVLVPANTFVATAEAVVLAGATPRFIDVRPDTLLVGPEHIEAAVTSRTRAAIVVALYGQTPDMDAVCRAAEKAGILLIEDAAQAQGATWRGQRAGSFGVAGCFSFYPGKNLGAFGDAGAVVTSDLALAAKVRSMRDHGRARGSHYEHAVVGTNSRLDAVQAVVLSAKLAHLDVWNSRRRAIAAVYREACAETTAARMVAELPEATGVQHLAVIQVPHRAEVQRMFESLGVTTAIHYPSPCHLIDAYRHYPAEELPVVEHAAQRILTLPMFPHLSASQLSRVREGIELVDQVTGGEPWQG